MDQSIQFLHNSNMRHSGQTRDIKSYNLFGETGDMPDLVHCEPIAARSKLHNWEFAPHRHARLHQVLLIEKGRGRVRLDGEEFALIGAMFVNVPVGCVHSYSFRPGARGFVLTIAAETLDSVIREGEGLRPALSRPFVGVRAGGMFDCMRRIWREYTALEFGRAHILRALSALALGQVARRIEEAGERDVAAGDTSLQARFEALVDRHFREHLSVEAYARRLAVAPGHLSRVLRRGTGEPASRIIEGRIVREARRLLAFTDLGVSEIAYDLGFADPAYFTRVFVRATGRSPRDFRKRLASGGSPQKGAARRASKTLAR